MSTTVTPHGMSFVSCREGPTKLMYHKEFSCWLIDKQKVQDEALQCIDWYYSGGICLVTLALAIKGANKVAQRSCLRPFLFNLSSIFVCFLYLTELTFADKSLAIEGAYKVWPHLAQLLTRSPQKSCKILNLVKHCERDPRQFETPSRDCPKNVNYLWSLKLFTFCLVAKGGYRDAKNWINLTPVLDQVPNITSFQGFPKPYQRCLDWIFPS